MRNIKALQFRQPNQWGEIVRTQTLHDLFQRSLPTIRSVLLAIALFLACPIDICAQSGSLADGDSIAIDSGHKYEGMDAPFAKGYEPSIKKNVMTLVVPFISEDKLEGNVLTVGVDFENREGSPFYYKNYRKQVKQSQEGVYLYKCRLKLKKDRVNGQYPLYLWAEGKIGGVLFRQQFTVYVEITDGKAALSGNGKTGLSPAGGEGFGQPGSGGDSSDPAGDGSGLSSGGGDLPGSEDGQIAGVDMPDAQSPAEENSSQPRLIVHANSLRATALEAGSSTPWNITVQNCSSRRAVKNIKVTLLCESKDIVFEKNAWYFEKTAANASMDLSQNLTVARKAAADPIQVQLQIEYEDDKGNAYTSTEEVRLLVRQPQYAQLMNLSFPAQVYASDTEFLNFQVQNTGLSAIYNVKVRLEAKGLFPQRESFLGNIEGGTSADGEQKVFVGTLDMDAQGNVSQEGGEKYGDTTGFAILSYENEQGEITEQKVEIHTTIREAETVKLEIEEQKPKTNQWWITIVFFVVLALLLVIIWLYLRMKHYQKMRA